ncbi:MAG TPA: POTRA domain-containing protein, partial [Vicinamibacteria bacterium]
MPRVALLAVVASLFLGSAHAQTPRAVVESIDLAGVTVYDREHVLRIIRAEPGSPLRRPAAAVAQTLETRYHDDGFLAARVTGAFDAPSATLRLDVVEGRLQDVAFPDLSPAAAERARRAAALESGEIL